MKTVLLVLLNLILSVSIFAAPGRLDLNFQNILTSGADVRAVETQTDGKILAAGSFTTRGAAARKNLVRLNADGSADSTFNFFDSTGNVNLVKFMKLQTDGKIVIVTESSNGSPRILRLNTSGGIDTIFNEQSGSSIILLLCESVVENEKIKSNDEFSPAMNHQSIS